MEEGIAAYRRAIQCAPRYLTPHYNLSLALHRQGKTDEAATECRKAIELNPAMADPHRHLGDILVNQKQSDQAIVEYQKAIALNPNDVRARASLAKLQGR